jgi:glutathione synthase
MDIYRKIIQNGVKQPIILGLHRSDYMLHEVENDPRTLMQVELNTIASSFGALSSKVKPSFKHS